jgi:hypothetical protein
MPNKQKPKKIWIDKHQEDTFNELISKSEKLRKEVDDFLEKLSGNKPKKLSKKNDS